MYTTQSDIIVVTGGNNGDNEYSPPKPGHQTDLGFVEELL